MVTPILDGARRRSGWRPPRSTTRTSGSGPSSASPWSRPAEGHAAEIIDEVERFVWSFPEIEVSDDANGGGWSERGTIAAPPRPARQYPRTARLNELLREIMAEELERIDDERLELVTVTAVDVDADLHRAIVVLSTRWPARPGDADDPRGARPAPRRLQAAIAARSTPARRPILQFLPDEVIRAADRIEPILRRPRSPTSP